MQLSEVVTVLNRLAPLRLAASWDNVGLLVEPSTPQPRVKRIMLTNDFTARVWQEAEQQNVNLIYCYHPVIFSPLKTLSGVRGKGNLLVNAIEKRVAIYCPHTAADAVLGGVNDWLVNGLGSGVTRPIDPVGDEMKEGYGRLMVLDEPVSIDVIVERVKAHLKLSSLWVARSSSAEPIQTVAVCAGSGADVLESIDAGVMVTGEMSHHKVLAAVEKGTHVIVCGHSNTERGYLHQLKPQMEKELSEAVEVFVSEVDADPLVVE